MPMKDLTHNVDILQSIAPAAISATATGSEVDLGTNPVGVMIVIPVGVISAADSSNYMTFTVTQCATSGGNFSAVDTDQYGFTADSWDKILNATSEGSTTKYFNFIPKATYRYIKVVGTETGTFSGIFGADVHVIKGHQPSAT